MLASGPARNLAAIVAYHFLPSWVLLYTLRKLSLCLSKSTKEQKQTKTTYKGSGSIGGLPHRQLAAGSDLGTWYLGSGAPVYGAPLHPF